MQNKTYNKLYTVLAPILRFVFGIKIIGAENEPEEGIPVFVCSNHISFADPIIISASLNRRQVRYMAKKEIFKVPVISSLARAFGAYPVDRKRADAGTVKRTIEMLKNGDSVGMFPQGTRCAGQDPATTKVKPGAGMICVRSEATVLPVHIRTKNYKLRLFCKTELIIGKPIPYDSIKCEEGQSGEYAAVSQKIFDAILALGNA